MAILRLLKQQKQKMSNWHKFNMWGSNFSHDNVCGGLHAVCRKQKSASDSIILNITQNYRILRYGLWHMVLSQEFDITLLFCTGCEAKAIF